MSVRYVLIALTVAMLAWDIQAQQSSSGASNLTDVAPVITAVGDQYYCIQSTMRVTTEFDIQDSQNAGVTAFYIQISQGYSNGHDKLSLSGTHPGIKSVWNSSEGKLSLLPETGQEIPYTILIPAVKDVVFSSTSTGISGEKHFSFTLGNANYLPETGHFYEYVPNIGIHWTQARDAAAARTYYGLQGYLATITSMAEAKLTGEQAPGAGWIGGSDQEQEGHWKWVTGPESGTVFWIGLANGSSPNGEFAYWNYNEPNQSGDEDYAHITAPNIGLKGAWNDLSNTGASGGDYQPKGYIVEYGGMPGDPDLNLSASTKFTVSEVQSTTDGVRCGPGVISLKATGNLPMHWFNHENSQTPIFIGEEYRPDLVASTRFYVAPEGCYDQKSIVEATIIDLPEIVNTYELKNCDEDGNPDGYTVFNLNTANPFITLGDDTLQVDYYASLAQAVQGLNPIPPVPYNNINGSEVYARIENASGCFEIATVSLTVSTTSFLDNFKITLEQCDDDGENNGITSFDLAPLEQQFLDQFPSNQDLSVHYFTTLSDAQLELNAIDTAVPFTNTSQDSQSIFVRVESNVNGDCFKIGPHLELEVNRLPEFTIPESEILCTNLGSISTSVIDSEGTYTYIWYDEQLNTISVDEIATITEPGTLTVFATSEKGCISEPRIMEIIPSSPADISLDHITIRPDAHRYTIAVERSALGPGDYEFALNNPDGPFSSSSEFYEVLPGDHMLYVRDKKECGISSIEVSVMGFPRFLSPNSDGINDYWQILGISADYQVIQPVRIFNRFGKLVAEFSPFSQGWNGTYNGDLLPASDYWYSLTIKAPSGNAVSFKGHFSLIRR